MKKDGPTILKWNCEAHAYEEYNPPWECSCYEVDMNKVVHCAACGRAVTYGYCFTSLEIHNAAGFGFAVCGECCGEEFDRKVKSKNESI